MPEIGVKMKKKKNDIWTIQDIEKILDFHKIST